MTTQIRRIARLSSLWARVARGNHRALLAAESALLRDLGVSVQRVTGEFLLALTAAHGPAVGTNLRIPGLFAVQRLAEGFRGDLTQIVLRGRREARHQALRRLDVELRAVERDLRLNGSIGRPMLIDRPEDLVFAQGAADALVGAWRAATMSVVLRSARSAKVQTDAAPQRPLPTEIRSAVAAQEHRLRRVAVTETARAYNAEHDEGAGWVGAQRENGSWLPLVAKRWDASLDRRTCAVCRSMDGRYTPLGMDFEGGYRPAEAHVLCRCVDSIVALPAHLRGEIIEGHENGDVEMSQRAA